MQPRSNKLEKPIPFYPYANKNSPTKGLVSWRFIESLEREFRLFGESYQKKITESRKCNQIFLKYFTLAKYQTQKKLWRGKPEGVAILHQDQAL